MEEDELATMGRRELRSEGRHLGTGDMTDGVGVSPMKEIAVPGRLVW